jgi:hypothetical protein
VDDLQARRDRLVRFCRTLPEATVTAHDQHLGFAVRGRTFAWFVDDEGGDGRVAVLAKAPAGENTGLVASDPHRFYLPRYVGSRGWVGCASTSGRRLGRGRRLVAEATAWSPQTPGRPRRPAPRLSYTAAVLPLPGFWLRSG